MRRTRWAIFWLLIFTAALWGQAQPAAVPSRTAAPSIPQPTSTQPMQIPPPSVFIKKMVAFLTLDCQDGAEAVSIKGTAFFVAVEDKRLPEAMGENRGFIYLVTNRHMVEPQRDGRRLTIHKVSLRLNLRSPIGGAQSEEGTLPLGVGVHWYFPASDATDLAVMPLAPDYKRYDYEPLPASLFATKEMIESEKIAEGEPVDFAGFFYQYPGQKKMEPIVRQGILAMMPDEELDTTLGKPGHLYLADVHVFHGNSGAPMFVNVGGVRGNVIRAMSFPYRLLGVVSGYFYETEDFHLEVATTLSGTTMANSGISMVVPVDELKALLDSIELRQMRDAEVARQALRSSTR